MLSPPVQGLEPQQEKATGGILWPFLSKLGLPGNSNLGL